MSEILEQENSIVLAAVQKFVNSGQEGAEKILNGREAKKEDDLGEKILYLLTAYRSKEELDDEELAAILYELRNLSGEEDFPSINPIVGQEIIYQIVADPANIEFFDEGTSLGDGVTEVNFTGAGVTATRVGNRIEVAVTGGGATTGAWRWVFNSGSDWDISAGLPAEFATATGGDVFPIGVGNPAILGPDGGPIIAGYIAIAKITNPGSDLADKTRWALIQTIYV